MEVTKSFERRHDSLVAFSQLIRPTRLRALQRSTSSRCVCQLEPIECPHWEQCAGCTLQEVAAQAKPPVFASAAVFFAEKLGYELPEPVVASSSLRWRSLAKLAVRLARRSTRGWRHQSGRPRVGLFRAGSHQVITVNQCRVHHASLNLAIACIERTLRSVALPIYDERSAENDSLRYVQLALERRTGRVQLVLVGYRDRQELRSASTHQGTRRLLLSSKWRAFCKQLWENGSKAHFGSALWHSIWVHLHAGEGNAIFASVHEPEQTETALWQQVYGDEPYVVDEPLAGEQGARMVFPPFAFQQANLGAFRALIQEVGTWCGNLLPDQTRSVEDASQVAAPAFERTTTGASPKVVATRMDSSNEIRIAEFCAGVGAIGQSVVCQLRKQPSRFQKIHLWASDIQAKNRDAFWEAARLNGLVTEADSSTLSLEYQVGSLISLARRVHEPDVAATVVIADPPRSGLGSTFIRETLLEPPPYSRLERFIYVSCSVPSFIRDVEQFATRDLERKGPYRWVLRYARPYLFFPGADHLELVAVFDRYPTNDSE